MLPKIKNIIIFVVILLVLILVYLFFFRSSTPEESLVSSTSNNTSATAENTVDGDFLPLLLSINNIKLDDSIFSDKAFMTLVDRSIELFPDGNEGRVNPFAPLGSDIIVNTNSSTPSTTPITPPKSTSPKSN